MSTTFAFIYAKNGIIKVINHDDAKELHVGLLRDGWKHTTTLDPCVFIRYLHNDCENIRREIKLLSK